jgi:hypothetical protein
MRVEKWLYTLRLRSLFHRQHVDQELDEELRYHVERNTEEYIAKGMSCAAPTECRSTPIGGSSTDARGRHSVVSAWESTD